MLHKNTCTLIPRLEWNFRAIEALRHVCRQLRPPPRPLQRTRLGGGRGSGREGRVALLTLEHCRGGLAAGEELAWGETGPFRGEGCSQDLSR